MKIAVVGPGGVGGYFGGLLAKAGMDVHFLGRGEHIRAIKDKGLKVESFKGDFDVEVNTTEDPAETGECDLILFCVKSFDTEKTAEYIKPMVGSETVLISFQNGIDNEELLGNILGTEKVMGGVAFIGARILQPGVILHTAAGNLTFGEMDGGMLERGKEILELFSKAGIEAKLSDNIKRVMWRKMVWNCGFNAITALTGSSVKEVLSCNETRRIIRQIMCEVISVAGESGIALGEELAEKTISHTEKQGEIKTSMLMDMENEKRMEIEALNGSICRIGKEHGIETPLNDMLYGMVKIINKKRGW